MIKTYKTKQGILDDFHVETVKKNDYSVNFTYFVGFLGCLGLFFLSILWDCANATEISTHIDIEKIIQIESHGRPWALNKRTGARGLMQIRSICLREWNNYHPESKYQLKDLYNPQINMKVGYWYLNNRIPAMLKASKLKITTHNILTCYNWGIGNLKSNKKIPKETINYIQKYLGLK